MYPFIHIVLPSYAVFAIIGLFAAMLFLYFRIEKYGLPFVDFLKMCAVGVIYAAIGSRLLFFITRIPWLVTHFSLAHLLSCTLGGGYVFYGGLLALLFGISRYCSKHNIEKRNIFNMIAPAIPLFHAFGRIGCFMAGCCHGFKLSAPVELFGFVRFAYFPTQLVEALFVFVLFLTICICQKKKSEANYLRIYLIAYAIFRFLIEFTRGDAIRGVVFGISTSQIISLGIIVVCLIQCRNEKRSALNDNGGC